MLECRWLFERLAEHGIRFYAGVPDSLLKSFCAYVSDRAPVSAHVTAANEGSALALAAGHYLATGHPGAVYLQNSGLGNLINPATSLVDPEVYRIPVLLLVGWRGEPGTRDEPQHVTMGRVMVPVLDAVGIPHAVLPRDSEKASDVLSEAARVLRSRCGAYALLVRAGTFESREAWPSSDTTPELGRESALARVLETMGGDAVLVSTTGMTSREIFELRERRGEPHDRDFLTVGAMGHCSQIALGIALERPNVPVICIDGDGALLMHMGGLATIGSLEPPNFLHVVLNNGAHDSVGGQPTAAAKVDLCGVARACGYVAVRRVERADELERAVADLCASPGPAFLEVRVRRGARSDLGRPTRTPLESRRRFMGSLIG